jgi:hypothetical protein
MLLCGPAAASKRTKCRCLLATATECYSKDAIAATLLSACNDLQAAAAAEAAAAEAAAVAV